MAIYIGKHLMGGLGYNIFNPALLARAFLLGHFPVAMTSAWLPPITDGAIFTYLSGIDGMTTATPLAVLKDQGMAAVHWRGSVSPEISICRFSLAGGPDALVETSGTAGVLGGLYLMYRRYITWHIPVSVIGSIAILTWIFGG